MKIEIQEHERGGISKAGINFQKPNLQKSDGLTVSTLARPEYDEHDFRAKEW